MALTPKQERFAQLVASGSSYSDAYRQAYDVSPQTDPATIHDNAYHLAHHTVIAPMIDSLRQAAASQMTALQAWSQDRLVTEAATNLELARSGGWKGAASANGAVELIARLTGQLDKKGEGQQVTVNRVTIILDRGQGKDGNPQVVEAQYQVLPSVLESDEEKTDLSGNSKVDSSAAGSEVA